MKKSSIIVIAIIIVVVIAIAAYFLLNNKEESNQQASNNSTSVTQEENNTTAIKLEYEGKDMTPGAVFSREIFGQEQSYSEVPSCAGQGTDKVYNYGSYEITAYQDGEEEKIYSVYFIDDQITTTEGVKISDDKSVMLEKYGESYEQTGNQYTYKSGNVLLAFIVENDFITSITYSLVIE